MGIESDIRRKSVSESVREFRVEFYDSVTVAFVCVCATTLNYAHLARSSRLCTSNQLYIAEQQLHHIAYF